jgi:hypothetical protein
MLLQHKKEIILTKFSLFRLDLDHKKEGGQLYQKKINSAQISQLNKSYPVKY